jgi:hypothetical protein
MSFINRGYGLLTGGAISLLFIAFLLIPTLAKADEHLKLNTILKKAEDAKLSQERYWFILLHYKPYRSGLRSLIDDPKFFLSREGKDNSRAELEATIRAFFNSTVMGDEHPICRFPARYAWLKERLDMADADFPDVDCKEFKHKRDVAVQPKALVLVFPSAYMNNPSSMFGHTMLRIDSAYQSRLLSHVVNYGADIDDSGILYPFKGIFGYYKGYFKIFPYYERIKEYADIEQRDMWEYQLDFSESEVQKMFLHLWELKDIYSYYYFFDENCSYNLLFLLEATRPSLMLTDGSLWVIPVDTLRMVKNSGITTGVTFRPAMSTRISHIASFLDSQLRQKALEIAGGKSEPSLVQDNGQDKIRVLDLAAEITQYQYNKGKQTKEEYQKRYLSILTERSKTPLLEEGLDKIPVPPVPEAGHFSGRFGLGIGTKNGTAFQEVRYRPAYHSLMDPERGYVEGSQIVFAETAVRYSSGGPVRLEHLNFIDIVSIAPRDDFFSPRSWKVNTGLLQKMGRGDDEQLTYQLNPGVGLAYKNTVFGLFYALAEANLMVGGIFRNNYALGIGVQAGVLKNIIDAWKIHLTAESMFFEIGDSFQEHQLAVVQSVTLSQNSSLELSLSWKQTFNNESPEAKCSWHYYF